MKPAIFATLASVTILSVIAAFFTVALRYPVAFGRTLGAIVLAGSVIILWRGLYVIWESR